MRVSNCVYSVQAQSSYIFLRSFHVRFSVAEIFCCATSWASPSWFTRTMWINTLWGLFVNKRTAFGFSLPRRRWHAVLFSIIAGGVSWLQDGTGARLLLCGEHESKGSLILEMCAEYFILVFALRCTLSLITVWTDSQWRFLFKVNERMVSFVFVRSLFCVVLLLRTSDDVQR